MKHFFTFLFIASCTFSIQAQQLYQYFDGEDTIPQYVLELEFDTTTSTNIWQIGMPQKAVFDTASTYPNVLVTDTLLTYPTNDTSRFSLVFTEQFGQELSSGGILAIEWMQQLDLDTAKDAGLIEYTLDSGQTWVSVFDNPNVYNIYGYDLENLRLINGTDSFGFTGTDTVWRNIWLCFEVGWFWDNVLDNGIDMRFTFLSDSIETNQDGWMIDNMQAHVTYVHTVAETEQEEYLNVYPNPTSGRVHIQAKKQKKYHITERLELFNDMGQLVKSYQHVPTKFFIDMDDLPNGKYILRVQTNVETQTFPIVLQRE